MGEAMQKNYRFLHRICLIDWPHYVRRSSGYVKGQTGGLCHEQVALLGHGARSAGTPRGVDAKARDSGEGTRRGGGRRQTSRCLRGGVCTWVLGHLDVWRRGCVPACVAVCVCGCVRERGHVDWFVKVCVGVKRVGRGVQMFEKVRECLCVFVCAWD